MQIKFSKIILCLLLLGALNSSTLLGSDWEKKVRYGVSGNKLEYSVNNDYNWGVQVELNIIKKFKSIEGFRLGWAVDFDYYTLGEVEALTDDAGYNADIMLLTGYSFKDRYKVPLELVLGLGYGFGQIGEDYAHGYAYKTYANYDLTQTLGVGIQFKHIDMKVVTLLGSFNSGLDIVSAFICIKI